MKPYYEKDGITIYHGDCREVLPSLPAESVDLVITSPPYNLGTTTGGGFPPLGHYRPGDKLGKRGGSGKWKAASRTNGLANGYGIHDDAMPHDDYVAWQKSTLEQCWRLLGPEGAIFYNHKPRILGGLWVSPLEYNPGLPVRQVIIWARAGGINFSPAFYLPTHEWIVVLAKEPFRLSSKGASGIGDVWSIAQEPCSFHPAAFPLEIPRRVLSTTQDGLVLDPFMGSGTTLRAAKDLGRKAIGIEIEEKYCEIAAKRMSQSVFAFE